ncbi:OadG family protein [bacterium]|nr:OadG family protein [bacterium]
MNAFNIQNIIQGSGISISLTGMAIVYSGLLIITIFIQLLPGILDLFAEKRLIKVKPAANKLMPAVEPKPLESSSTKEPVDEDEEKDIASLIGLVLHLEQERHFRSDNRYITMDRNSSQYSMWGRTGKMRSTPQRRTYAKV